MISGGLRCKLTGLSNQDQGLGTNGISLWLDFRALESSVNIEIRKLYRKQFQQFGLEIASPTVGYCTVCWVDCFSFLFFFFLFLSS